MPKTSSQKAVLIALTRALTLSKCKWANIYTDSKYTSHSVFPCHHLAGERIPYCQRHPITNGPLIYQLLQAANLPTKVGVIHCHGHQIGSDEISRGNRKANKIAKEVSLSSAPASLLITPTIQPQYSPTKKASLLQQGASFQGNWLVKNQKLILPQEQTKDTLTSLH